MTETKPKTMEKLTEELYFYVTWNISNAKNERTSFYERLDARRNNAGKDEPIADLFAAFAEDLAGKEAIEREMNTILTFLNAEEWPVGHASEGKTARYTLPEKAEMILKEIGKKRSQFRVDSHRSTNPITNALEYARQEALHKLWFDGFSTSGINGVEKTLRQILALHEAGENKSLTSGE
jgi:hypothetical protein